jgi:pyridinium-3,5-biscarboxylic acid mononucleotide synthase
MQPEDILKKVAAGTLPVEEALRLLQARPEENLGFARIDLERHRRRGIPEVVFSSGKTPDQVIRIISVFKDARQNVLCTRAGHEMFDAVSRAHPEAAYHAEARMITLDVTERPPPAGQVAVVSAGTSDIPVAEEAAVTAEWMGARVERIYDVGVAGLHRLMNHIDTLRASRAVVVVAGMEGALPSVVGGLIDRPIVAVPTSIGYGTHLQGLAPLLAMLNTCVPGIAVVNIDNGFGAGVTAALINRVGEGA